MSYPQIIANTTYALVEVRASATNVDYNSMPIIYSGRFEQGNIMYQQEGWRICVRRCNYPSDPASGLGAINCVSGWNGINVGNPETMYF